MTLEHVPDAPMGVVIRRDFGGLAEIREVNARLRPCRHTQTIVDEDDRTVACGTCGKALDAFEVLLEYARKERHWRHWEAEVSRCHAALAELKAEERKVKARTKNATRKEADAAVAAERVRTERERLAIAELARDAGALCRRIDGLARRPAR